MERLDAFFPTQYPLPLRMRSETSHDLKHLTIQRPPHATNTSCSEENQTFKGMAHDSNKIWNYSEVLRASAQASECCVSKLWALIKYRSWSPLSHTLPRGHMTFIQRCINVDPHHNIISTLMRRFDKRHDVASTSIRRCSKRYYYISYK